MSQYERVSWSFCAAGTATLLDSNNLTPPEGEDKFTSALWIKGGVEENMR
jgi:hypothetical protein